MRLAILWLFLIAAALLGELQSAAAQSPTSYPWCAKYFESWTIGATSCYFTSYQQCMTTMSGIGGLYFKSPYYHGVPPDARVPPRRRRHA